MFYISIILPIIIIIHIINLIINNKIEKSKIKIYNDDFSIGEIRYRKNR